jgi:hypothetical protein
MGLEPLSFRINISPTAKQKTDKPLKELQLDNTFLY